MDMQLILATILLCVMPFVVYIVMIQIIFIIHDVAAGLVRSMKQAWPFCFLVRAPSSAPQFQLKRDNICPDGPGHP